MGRQFDLVKLSVGAREIFGKFLHGGKSNSAVLRQAFYPANGENPKTKKDCRQSFFELR
jgi:hypothetical protein